MKNITMDLSTAYYDSPIGKIKIAGTAEGISVITVNEKTDDPETAKSQLVITCIEQLKDYFAGEREIFDFPLSPRGTPFQLQVWKALAEIPYGKTCAYKDVAIKTGRATSVRAVANAIGKNPLLIVIPCHRVIGSDGSLTGFSAGIWRKEWLLNKEGHYVNDNQAAGVRSRKLPAQSKRRI